MVAQTSSADIANTRFAQKGQQYEETSQAEKRSLHDQTEIIKGGNRRHNRAYPKSFAQLAEIVALLTIIEDGHMLEAIYLLLFSSLSEQSKKLSE
uniref:Uncharacterized protein n=1 Tax=Thermosporothrix sp. COM3 TaxID=2490863 RepID=A0A455SIC7_9CHLR|nr:hypothetical protein KTC_20710 [Thermosporothrix sp. COM3]